MAFIGLPSSGRSVELRLLASQEVRPWRVRGGRRGCGRGGGRGGRGTRRRRRWRLGGRCRCRRRRRCAEHHLGAGCLDQAVSRAVRRHDHAEHCQSLAAGGAVEAGVAVAEDPAVRGDQPITRTRRCAGHADDGLVESDGARGAVEPGVAVAEDPAVRGDQPITRTRRCVGHADDGLVESDGARGAEEPGVAVAEDASVGGDQPIARTRRCACHAHDGLVQVDGARGAEEPGVAVAEDPSVGGDQPIARTRRCAGHADDRLVQVDIREGGRAQGGRTPVGSDGAGRCGEPIATVGIGRHQPPGSVEGGVTRRTDGGCRLPWHGPDSEAQDSEDQAGHAHERDDVPPPVCLVRQAARSLWVFARATVH